MSTLSPKQINAYLVKKIIQDLVIECSSASQVVIKQDSVAGADDGAVVMKAASDLTLDITSSGANGLDTGSEASDTWYYIYLIWNPTTEATAGLLSASATSPTLPSGYTKKRLVGAVRNDSSSDFLQFIQLNCRIQYDKQYSIYNANNSAWTTINAGNYVPSITRKVIMTTRADTNSNINIRYTSSNGVCVAGIPNGGSLTKSSVEFIISASQQFAAYSDASGGATIGFDVWGYVLTL